MRPGSSADPFAPPAAADGLIDAGTATRLMSSTDGEPESEHALGWGRVGPGITEVELRTDDRTVRVPVASEAGYFIMVATGQDPSIAVHSATDDPGATP